MVAELVAAVPELDSLGLREVARASCSANVRAGLRALECRALPERPPEEAVLAARAGARVGLPLALFAQSYRVSHAVLSDTWVAEVTALHASDSDKHELLVLGSRFTFAMIDWMIGVLTEEYEDERRHHRGPARKSVTVVQETLAGRRSDLSAVGYDETLIHRALICAAPVSEALPELASRLDLRLLNVALETDVVWAWLGSIRARDQDTERRALTELCGETASVVTAGDCLAGVEGFVASHRQAQDALRIARRRGARLTLYSDVALEVALLQDERLARELVGRELGELAANDPKAEVLRDTLRAYLESGQNAVAASARLGVHVHTVKYRLRNIEEQLGRAPATRPSELHVALRVREVLENPGQH
ncbi:MAG: helix-turn-helix domain-containing protein [Thermoleophilaceae bacterium]